MLRSRYESSTLLLQTVQQMFFDLPPDNCCFKNPGEIQLHLRSNPVFKGHRKPTTLHASVTKDKLKPKMLGQNRFFSSPSLYSNQLLLRGVSFQSSKAVCST